MTKVQFICLANSRKPKGQCVAGWIPDEGKWVRPVSHVTGGALRSRERRYLDGREPLLLDLVKAELDRPCPEDHQPENWVIGKSRWEQVEHLDLATAENDLKGALVGGPALLGSIGEEFVDYAELKKQTEPKSLALIEPRIIQWHVVEKWYTKENKKTFYKQVRCSFELSGASYNLPVTDLTVEGWFKDSPCGDYPRNSKETNFRNRDRILLTISRAGPMKDNNDRCYKLIAGVIY